VPRDPRRAGGGGGESGSQRRSQALGWGPGGSRRRRRVARTGRNPLMNSCFCCRRDWPGCRNWGWNHSPSRAGIRLRFSDSLVKNCEGGGGGWVGKARGLQVTHNFFISLSAEEKSGKNFSAQEAVKVSTGVEEIFHVKAPCQSMALQKNWIGVTKNTCAQYPNNSRIRNESTLTRKQFSRPGQDYFVRRRVLEIALALIQLRIRVACIGPDQLPSLLFTYLNLT
jgi:hypothetical protein